MTWIRTIAHAGATGRLKQLYDRVKGPGGRIDNIMTAHSLRPHSMEGHMALYKYVLHHSANAVPEWLLETLGVAVSLINGCDYCVDHHFAGLARLLGDRARADAIRGALEAGRAGDALDANEAAAVAYAAKLTRTPAEMEEADVAALRAAGWDDGEILEINQVVAYFAYANRTVLGLGVTTEGDALGLLPGSSDDPHD
jgi:uncharacterized peroxidase-related enzyme